MKNILLPVLLLTFLSAPAQDTLVMKNGRQWAGTPGRLTSVSLEFVTVKKGPKTFAARRVDFIRKSGQRSFPFDCFHRYNGLTVTVGSLREDGLFLKYTPSGGKKEKKIKKDKVFSYHTGGKETVLFRPFISKVDTLTEANARSLTEGRQDARRYYKNPWTGLVNFGIGFASGYFLNYWGIFVPAAYTGIYSAVNPVKSKRKVRLLGTRYLTDEYYRYGFNSKAKITKLKWSAGGGLAGLLAGIGVIEYIKSKADK